MKLTLCSWCDGVVEEAYRKYGATCRSCRTRMATERNRANPERARAAGLRWRLKNKGTRHRAAQAWKRQGIAFSLAEYTAMLSEQGGRCAICRTDDPGGSQRSGSFFVDHDHAFGHVRGLLCFRCNRALGILKDSPATFRAAASYLDRTRPTLKLINERA